MGDSGRGSSRSAFLIDGHHVFLETVSQVRTFSELMRDSAILEVTFSDLHFRRHGIAQNPSDAASTFVPALTAIDYADIALVDLLYPGLAYSEHAEQLEMYWFDAEMPPAHELKDGLRTDLQRIGQDKSTYFRFQKMLRVGKSGLRPMNLNFIMMRGRSLFPTGSRMTSSAKCKKQHFLAVWHYRVSDGAISGSTSGVTLERMKRPSTRH